MENKNGFSPLSLGRRRVFVPGVHRLQYPMADRSPANQLGGMLQIQMDLPEGSREGRSKGEQLRLNPGEIHLTACIFSMQEAVEAPSLVLSSSLARPLRYARASVTEN